MSVAEYEVQFTKLSKFAPELVMTERKRVRRFVQGLNVEIQEALAADEIDTFTDALEKVQKVESARLQVKAFQTRKRNAPSGTSRQVNKDTSPPKMGREAGGIKIPRLQKGAVDTKCLVYFYLLLFLFLFSRYLFLFLLSFYFHFLRHFSTKFIRKEKIIQKINT